jgi:PBSX family phage terminase large subunit
MRKPDLAVAAAGLPLSPKQVASMRSACRRVNIWHGSIRSGKTIASLMRWLMFVTVAPRGGALVVVGRTRDSIARNVFGPLTDPDLFGPIANHVHYTSGAPTASVLGRTVYVLGASDIKAEKVLRGLTVAGAYVDEVTVIPEGFFTQLLGRMSVAGAQLFGTTNPDNPAHWLKRRFLDRAAALGWAVTHFVLADNPALSRAYVASVSAEFTGLWYRRFILGEWVAAEGAVYDMWDATTMVVPWQALPPMARILGIGLDYGTTNPTAALTLGMTESGVLYLLDEWRHDPARTSVRLSDTQLSAGFRGFAQQRHTPQPVEPRLERTYVDPAAASLKVQLYADQFEGLVDADNNVAYGIRTVASLLTTGRLFVSDRCPGFIEEVTGYCWDDGATARGQDAPVKVADHSLDAGRYVIASTEPIWRDAAADPLAAAVLRNAAAVHRSRDLDLLTAPM